MARFRGTLQGARGHASRLGNAKSGLTVTANGWLVGIEVGVAVGPTGRDTLTVTATGGSGGISGRRVLGQLVDVDGVPNWRPV